MKYFFSILLVIGTCWTVTLFGQTNFRKSFKITDPVDSKTPFVFDGSVAIHTDFLREAAQANDSLKQIYGNLFLYIDHMKIGDFPGANAFLLEAEKIAKSSGNLGWQGWVNYQKGVWFIWMKKEKEALPFLELANNLCGTVGDSLCFAETLEQMAAMYSQLDNFEEATRLYSQAIPIIEKYGGDNQISATINNFGIFLSRQGRPADAIPFIEKSIAINHKNGSHKQEGQAMNNLAEAYWRLKKYDLAIEVYDKCLQHNKKFNLPSNLLTNYRVLREIYKEKGEYQSADSFLVQYYELKDSLIGARTKLQIAEMETKYEVQEKEIALEKSQNQLSKTERFVERGIGAVLILLAAVAFGLWRWKAQRTLTQKELAQNYDNLKQLTQVLLDKNTEIGSLQTQILDLEEKDIRLPVLDDLDENLYNQKILTDADWIAFKSYFEKTYPGYLRRLRSTWPTLSEAEERLFLFLKLNLTRKEAASILGISIETIKKTRSRLRKRLGIGSGESLEELIQGF